MQKQAPSVSRILVAVGFTLSCFALLLFLWIVFGGPVPLKSKSYRVSAYFPEATQLAPESDVRIGGVSVGKVKEISLADADLRVNGKDTTEAVIEIRPEYAPISSDSKAILRQKTLLGETYVELTSGTEPVAGEAAPISLGADALASDADIAAAEPVEEGGDLGIGQTEENTQIDEIFNALDEETRTSFQRWQASAAVAIRDRGLDFNDALGNLAPFITDATDVVEILDRQQGALEGIVRDTGTTFEALTARGRDLTGTIVGSKNTFEALASEEEALAETFAIFPTFQRESRLTFERLDEFQLNARPLIQDLIPIARDLSPTLDNVRRLSPNLRNLFIDLDDLQQVSLAGLPALRKFLVELAPVIRALDPFLSNLNPVIRYLEYQKPTVADFLTGPGVALSGQVDGLSTDPAPRHYLRQLSISSTESLAITPNRLSTNRGNGYLADGVLNNLNSAGAGIFPNFDCKNTDYSGFAGGDPDEDFLRRDGDPNPEINMGGPVSATYAACFITGEFPESRFGSFGDGRAPQIFRDP